MIALQARRITIILLLVSIVFGQALILFTPKPAQAFLGLSFDFSTLIGNPFQIAQDIGTAVAERIALNFANQYVQRFTNQLLDKYKIRNYLYYGKLLNYYYLSNYVADKISDPDLRRAFTLLANNVKVTATPGSTSTLQQREDAETQYQQAVMTYYTDQGGVDPNLVDNPDPNVSNDDYLDAYAASQYYTPDEADSDLQAQFSQAQADSDTAAQQEIAAGNGLKSSHGTNTSSSGATVGGSATAGAMSFIQNPGAFVQTYVDSSIKTFFTNNLTSTSGSDKTYSQLGSLLGDFLYKQLGLNDATGILNETQNTYQPSGAYSASNYTDVDLDGDGLPDVQEDATGAVVTCYNGLIDSTQPPSVTNCIKSTTISSSAYFTPLCQAISSARTALATLDNFATAHTDMWNGPFGPWFLIRKEDGTIWVQKTLPADTSVSDLVTAVDNYHNPNWDNMEIAMNRFSNYMDGVVQELESKSDLALQDQWSSYSGVDNLIFMIEKFQTYLTDINDNIGKCDNPNFAATGAIVPPDFGSVPVVPAPNDALQKHPDQSAVVAQVISQLQAQGVDLSGICGAAAITRNVAWQLQASGGGLMTGSNSESCASSIEYTYIEFPDGYVYNILGNPGVNPGNTPQWVPVGCGSVGGPGTCPSLYILPTQPSNISSNSSSNSPSAPATFQLTVNVSDVCGPVVAQLSIVNGPNNGATGTTDDTGQFVFNSLQEGVFSVHVTANNHTDADSNSITLNSDQTINISLDRTNGGCNQTSG